MFGVSLNGYSEYLWSRYLQSFRILEPTMKFIISGALALSTFLSVVSLTAYSKKDKEEYLTNSSSYFYINTRPKKGLQQEVVIKNLSRHSFSKVKIGVVLLDSHNKAVQYKIITLKNLLPQGTFSETITTSPETTEIQSRLVDLEPF